MIRQLFLVLAFFSAGALGAAEVAATLIKTVGKGRVTLPGGAAGEFRDGTLLRPGSRIVTEEASQAVLLMGDGSRVNLGANTDLQLSVSSVEGEARSTVFDLFKGLFRATVEKLTVASKFEVRTADAVAAVKGTDFEVEVDESGTDARVKEGTVWLEDEKGERAVIKAGRAARAERRGRLREVREMRREELDRFGRWAAWSLPGRSPEQQARADAFWNSLRPEQQQRLLAAFREGIGDEAWNDIANTRHEERQERWKARLRASDERRLAAEESHVDFALRKTSIDIKGRRVRFEEYLLRPAADKIQFLNYSRREGRTDFLSSIKSYNIDLPRKLSEAQGLNQKGWDQLAMPKYWVINDYLVLGNNSGDSFASQTTFYDPVKVAFRRWELPVNTRETRLNLPDVRVFAGGELVERWVRSGSANVQDGNIGVLPVTGNSIAVLDAINSDMEWDATAPGLASSAFPVYRALSLGEIGAVPGDFASGISITYGNGRSIQLRSYGIDESGKILNLGDLLASRSPLDALSTFAFRTLSEIQMTSNGFSGDIDVVSKLLWFGTISRDKDTL